MNAMQIWVLRQNLENNFPNGHSPGNCLFKDKHISRLQLHFSGI